eukprot:29851-Pelagococcus_subviridis.AAC.2
MRSHLRVILLALLALCVAPLRASADMSDAVRCAARRPPRARRVASRRAVAVACPLDRSRRRIERRVDLIRSAAVDRRSAAASHRSLPLPSASVAQMGENGLLRRVKRLQVRERDGDQEQVPTPGVAVPPG